MLRAAAEAQRQRKQGGAPPLAAAASGASPAPAAAAAEPATGTTDALVQQVLRRGSCPFHCLGLERGASQEGVRKRYLARPLRHSNARTATRRMLPRTLPQVRYGRGHVNVKPYS